MVLIYLSCARFARERPAPKGRSCVIVPSPAALTATVGVHEGLPEVQLPAAVLLPGADDLDQRHPVAPGTADLPLHRADLVPGTFVLLATVAATDLNLPGVRGDEGEGRPAPLHTGVGRPTVALHLLANTTDRLGLDELGCHVPFLLDDPRIPQLRPICTGPMGCPDSIEESQHLRTRDVRWSARTRAPRGLRVHQVPAAVLKWGPWGMRATTRKPPMLLGSLIAVCLLGDQCIPQPPPICTGATGTAGSGGDHPDHGLGPDPVTHPPGHGPEGTVI